MAEDRVTKTWVEVASSSTFAARVSKLFAEVALVPPQGTLVTRTFVEVAATEPADPDPGGPVADDTIAEVVFPSYEADGDPPSWVTLRGQDVRAWDHAAGRAVWGPQHAFMAPSDVGLTNGLIRCRFGDQGQVGHLTVEAFRNGEWRDMGTIYFANPSSTDDTIQRVRLARCTVEQAIAVLELRHFGPILVALRRGERMLRITHGSTLPPTDTLVRRVQWSTAPSGTEVDGIIVSAPDAQDLIRGVCTLEGAATQSPGSTLGLQLTADVFEVGAFVAINGEDNDEPDDHHAQYAGDCEQELRLR